MFFKGFQKEAAVGGMLMRGAAVARKAGKGLLSGLREAGGQTIGDAAKLKGLKNVQSGMEAASKKKGLANKAGEFAKGLGKAAPSIAAAGAYGLAAKKVYDKTLGDTESQNY